MSIWQMSLGVKKIDFELDVFLQEVCFWDEGVFFKFFIILVFEIFKVIDCFVIFGLFFLVLFWRGC